MENFKETYVTKFKNLVVSKEALEIPKKVYFINKTYIIWAGAED
jgi:hypothetical protein